MQKLCKQLDELESYIPQLEVRNDAISASTVGWQIEHDLLVISSVIEGVKRSDPAAYKWQFKPLKYVVFWRGVIPRGKVGAPKLVTPGEITQDTLQAHIALCRQRLVELEQIGAGHYFTHPFFGDLKKKETIPFLFIHTEHHLKIIREMLAS
jgi:hypothetical protein